MKSIEKIATIHSDFAEKFGIPRQSGLVSELQARIVFEPQFQNLDALRGLEEFSHIWVIWGFSEAERTAYSPTVRPPRLGGNVRMGVFATRSPFRPNSIGLSSVQLQRIEAHKTLGPVLHILGADMMHGTPVYDIKPYLPYTDSHPDANGGFASQPPAPSLEVVVAPQLLHRLPKHQHAPLLKLLSHDPRPPYRQSDERVYGMSYAGFNVEFTVAQNLLTVQDITPL